jgi:hypothetical protein
MSNSEEYSVLQALEFQEVRFSCKPSGGTGVSHNWHNESFVKLSSILVPTSHFLIEHMFSCTCARHWLQFFPYGVSMSSSCRRWHQVSLHYLHEEFLLHLVIVSQDCKSPREVGHLSFPSCSCADTTSSLQFAEDWLPTAEKIQDEPTEKSSRSYISCK